MLFPDEPAQDLPEPAPLPQGTMLGNYVLRDRIGYGAMGAVYRAEHTLLKKAVAVKVMAAPLMDDADARERFLLEGQAAAALAHSNVVDVTDVGVSGTTPFLVMELLEGEDLDTFLNRRAALSESEVADLIVPIVAALACAHDRGIVHCDLKPSNIFVARGSNGEVTPKILDFGICRLAHSIREPDLCSTPFKPLMGSPSYLPPEALKGMGYVSGRCDQYSLGVVLYECVTGRTPFQGESLFLLLSAIATGEFEPPKQSRPDISPVLEGIIVRAMQTEPELRFRDMRELGRALLQVARPRTRLLWGPAFGCPEQSADSLIVNHQIRHWRDSPASGRPLTRRRAGSRLQRWSRAALLLVVGYVFIGLRSTWQAPAVAAVMTEPAWLESGLVSTGARPAAPPNGVEPVPDPIVLDATLPPIASRPVEPTADVPRPAAHESSSRNGAGAPALRRSKRKAPRELLSEVRRMSAGVAPRSTIVILEEVPTSATLANEAPIPD